ncbi:phosphorothioated DNA-binding restriction endonuclease [Streptomyces coffeae]|uniref:HNH endonuclease n=1 Tax=Streptomyces coffeae TaxID=621382 RepID=A0ABS1NG50_9ACTN|nr:HNH endonuclease [Streptomyces coffeae]MBL1099051.1 HNH endonuclease [Streptomyces coffeae]
MDWVERVRTLRQWSGNGVRAPHKPLLMLYALGRFQQAPEQDLRYTEVERDLKDLLRDFGPPRTSSPSYPFHHLESDGVWEVRTDHGHGSPGSTVGVLRSSGARGQLAPELRSALATDPLLLGRLTQLLLDTHFPPSLHADIAAAVRLDLEDAEEARRVTVSVRDRRRAAELRREVLSAYAYRCAFCGFDGAIGRVPVGLEAAHVRWWAFRGANSLHNALCLCSLHHRLFDRGVLGLDPARRIRVSDRFTGRGRAARDQVLELAGRGAEEPRHGGEPIAPENIAWHSEQVFRGEARTAGPVATN